MHFAFSEPRLFLEPPFTSANESARLAEHISTNDFGPALALVNRRGLTRLGVEPNIKTTLKCGRAEELKKEQVQHEDFACSHEPYY